QFLKAPFTLGNSGDLEELFVESGFSSPVIKSYDITADFPSVEKMIRADVDGWFPLAGIELDDAQVDEVIAETETALTEYIAEDGGIAFTMPAYFVTNFDY
ncbi:MAG: hypothetical protein R3211_05760, partial [Balneolaceae bacterium]|nr:hypothetical protein [Balneolaceae bacterium]